MAGLGDGQVPITLGGDVNYLTPTIRAAFVLSRKWNGFANLERAMLNRDLDAYVDVLMAGANVVDDRREEIERVVYMEGVATGGDGVNTAFLAAIDEYVAVLQNGGRPLNTTEDGDDQKEDDQGEAGGV